MMPWMEMTSGGQYAERFTGFTVFAAFPAPNRRASLSTLDCRMAGIVQLRASKSRIDFESDGQECPSHTG
jgi:hypothetical protein